MANYVQSVVDGIISRKKGVYFIVYDSMMIFMDGNDRMAYIRHL